MQKVTLYTDGACSGNPGPGGWAYVISCNNTSKENFGSQKETTNNRMELTAVIKGLECLKRACNVDVFSDSSYVVNAFNQNWVTNWQKNDFLNSKKEEIKNSDLWKELIMLSNKHNVTWHLVKGHANNELNNRCDKLATSAYAEFLIKK